MCGIAGWYSAGAPYDRATLEQMRRTLAHRGPDDHGTFFDPEAGIALAHNRLSIVDLSERGHQPMHSEDGRWVLAYNGELYNFRALRRELEQMGRRFRSQSDTEVLLHALSTWGHAALDRFCGMFAFALWDRQERRLLLVRDPMGMKPLYYWARPGGGVVFVSEIKALWPLPDFQPRIDRRALGQFIEFGYTYEPHRTILAGVHKLPSGHQLALTDGKVESPQRYFLPVTDDGPASPTRDPVEERLYETLSQVVDEHLNADVPVALLLSGGLDSSLLAALAARQRPIRTFSMGFADSQVDERPQARLVSRHIGSQHEEFLFSPADITEGLEENAVWFDDVFGDWGRLSTRLLYRQCREAGVKVVLVGEGADELFGGYPSFEFAFHARGAPAWWRAFLLYRYYAGRRYGAGFPRFWKVFRRCLRDAHGSFFGAIRLFETRHQLPNNFVMKVDKASMSVSVEARAPYLDRRVAEIAYRIDAQNLMHGGHGKHVLRTMAEQYRLLPPETIWRDKFGAGIAASWMDAPGEFRRYAEGIILRRRSWTDALGLRRPMRDYFSATRTGYGFPRAISIFRNVAWRLLILNLWADAYGLGPDGAAEIR
jgi:asparagine synthase (glutamine-hydrolysing)